MWGIIDVQIYCVMRAFGLDLPITAAFVVTTAGVLGLVVPTPGGVGGYHAAVQYALTGILHVPVTTATTIAIVSHAVSFVPISAILVLDYDVLLGAASTSSFVPFGSSPSVSST